MPDFHFSRRYRRPLLLPPGLLALAGLLLVGCLALRPWQENLSRKVVIQLAMPLYPPRNEKPTIRFELPNPSTVCKTCAWSDAYFTGRVTAEKQEQTRVEQAIHTFMADSVHGGGIRVHFSSASYYRNLVSVLNILEKEKARKFWLDIHHIPTTLYAFKDPPDPSVRIIGGCLLCNDVIYAHPPPPPPIPFWARFDNTVTEYWQLILQSDWRAPTFLLAIIACISAWRITRAWRMA
ncbi:MAG: hypothetical protein M3Y54_17460 [Bacteroidota bacterium]|nr:hypothetical protein [Bacteroidota bacterium]